MKNVIFFIKINNIQALVEIMGWHLTGDNLLSKPMMALLSWPRWINIAKRKWSKEDDKDIAYELTPCNRCSYLCFSLLYIVALCLCFVLVYQYFAAQLCHYIYIITLDQVKECCQMLPSCYLIQYSVIINWALRHIFQGQFNVNWKHLLIACVSESDLQNVYGFVPAVVW